MWTTDEGLRAEVVRDLAEAIRAAVSAYRGEMCVDDGDEAEAFEEAVVDACFDVAGLNAAVVRERLGM